MMREWLLAAVVLWGAAVRSEEPATPPTRLRTRDNHQQFGILHFGVTIHCSVNTCLGDGSRVRQDQPHQYSRTLQGSCGTVAPLRQKSRNNGPGKTTND